MNNNQTRNGILSILSEVMQKEEGVLFAYLYGSYAHRPAPPGGDIDVAVYLKPSDIKSYITKEEELTFILATKLHNDKIDLRILNVAPFLLQYNVIKDGFPFFVRKAQEKVDFETRVMERFFELKPYLDEYRQMLALRIKGVT
jgi:predicted nucleotidyltransferase